MSYLDEFTKPSINQYERLCCKGTMYSYDDDWLLLWLSSDFDCSMNTQQASQHIYLDFGQNDTVVQTATE